MTQEQFTAETLAMADFFQKDCHATIDAVMRLKPECTHQDAMNVWLFKKLAELHVRIAVLEKGGNQ